MFQICAAESSIRLIDASRARLVATCPHLYPLGQAPLVSSLLSLSPQSILDPQHAQPKQVLVQNVEGVESYPLPLPFRFRCWFVVCFGCYKGWVE